MFGFENMLHSEFTELPFKIMFLTIIFLFGICIGSFLNVVIIRLPNHESLIKRSSHCMTCQAKIRPIDLIPVFSWLFLRGKCHSCGAKISSRYPIVESLNGILFVLTFIVLDINAGSIITCVLMSLLIVVGFMDWDTMEIDMIMVGIIFALTIPAILFTDETDMIFKMIGVIFVCAMILLYVILSRIESWGKLDDELIIGCIILGITLIAALLIKDQAIRSRLVGALSVSVPFFIIGEISRIFIRKKTGEDFRAIELGDTYLMFACGALLGTRAVIVSAFVGIITAAVVGLLYKKITGQSKFAFGPYLSIGAAFGALWGDRLAQWYIDFITYTPQ